MAPCRFKNCTSNAPDGEWCIRHSDDPGKDAESFRAELRDYLNRDQSDFTGWIFPEAVSFRPSDFSLGGNFAEATFTHDVDFTGCAFDQRTTFTGATFCGVTAFTRATFNNMISFYKTRFISQVDFTQATFSLGVTFSGAAFDHAPSFDMATFDRELSFAGARFPQEEPLSFRGCHFRGHTVFHAPEESAQGVSRDEQGRVPFLTKAQPVDFRDILLDSPDALTFSGTDLRRCRFLGTDLRTVHLVGVIWPKKGKRVVVYDEICLEAGEGNLDQVEQLYRHLKQNYENQRDYDRAGDFHYGEKEMRRRNPRTPRGRRMLLWLYWVVSGYGERLGRPLGWAFVLWGLSTFAYGLWGLTPKGKETALLVGDVKGWLTAALYSLRVIVFLKPTDLVPVGFGGLVVHTFQSLLGPLLLGLFALAVRQRLKR